MNVLKTLPGEQVLKLTPDEFAEIMKQEKPYLMALEATAEEIGYGKVTVELNVRAGIVEKMEYIEVRKPWFKPKATLTIGSAQSPIDAKSER